MLERKKKSSLFYLKLDMQCLCFQCLIWHLSLILLLKTNLNGFSVKYKSDDQKEQSFKLSLLPFYSLTMKLRKMHQDFSVLGKRYNKFVTNDNEFHITKTEKNFLI